MALLTRINGMWSAGSQGQPPWRVRQIALTNRIALFAAVSTVPYQLFYLITDARYYAPVLLVNLGFTVCYMVALALNRALRFDLALNVAVGGVYLHLFAVTSLVGTGTGVHLFYFSLGASLGMLYVTGREPAAFFLMALATTLFLVCHFAFPPGEAWLRIPPTPERVMFAAGAMGAVFLAGGFSFLFRLDIDRAERDLTRSNNELARLSALDPLTGLANRRTLDAYLTREWARLCREDRHVGVLLCDVDYFKEFNDHYGHLAGDTCLQRVATALSGAAQRSGDLVARYGGEEFILVLGMTDPAHASDVAEKARAIVMDLGLPHGHSAVAPVVTISVGVVVAAANDLVEPQDLLQRADQALYAAKHQGRNRVVHADPPAVLEAGAPLSSTQA